LKNTVPSQDFWKRLAYFCKPWDGRFEDLAKGNWKLNVLKDFTAGLIVAMVAIPLAMGLAVASGLPPAMGIVGGAVAGLVGALFGGSKYQVYGPTAAFIPVIMAISQSYPGNYSFLIWCSIAAGVILMILGLAGWGRIVSLVPNSIVVGFTMGIAVYIAMTQFENVLGLKSQVKGGFFNKINGLAEYGGEISIHAIILGLGTFLVVKYVLKISPFIPAPLIAVGLATLLAGTGWSGMGLTLIKDKFAEGIPTDLLVLTLPGAVDWTPTVVVDFI
jgi:SulP family sulfate permease